MNPEPVTLAPPATLHHDGRFTVWHTGVVLGPPGFVVLSLEVASPEELAFRTEPWRQGGAPPIDAYIEIPASHGPGPIVGSSASGIDRYVFHYRQWFPGQPRGAGRFQPIRREQLVGAALHVKIHPLELHQVVELSPQ